MSPGLLFSFDVRPNSDVAIVLHFQLYMFNPSYTVLQMKNTVKKQPLWLIKSQWITQTILQ